MLILIAATNELKNYRDDFQDWFLIQFQQFHENLGIDVSDTYLTQIVKLDIKAKILLSTLLLYQRTRSLLLRFLINQINITI